MILFFIIGMIVGIVFRIKIFKKLNLLSLTTLALLFFVGVEIGTNDELFKSLSKIGIIGFLIAIFSIAGSILLTWIFESFLKRKIGR